MATASNPRLHLPLAEETRQGLTRRMWVSAAGGLGAHWLKPASGQGCDPRLVGGRGRSALMTLWPSLRRFPGGPNAPPPLLKHSPPRQEACRFWTASITPVL